MNLYTFHEAARHGTLEFPCEYHYVNPIHPRYNMPFHWHKEWEIIHVLEGTFVAQIDNREYIAHTGDILLIRDGMLHGGTSEDCIYECILFDLHRLFIHNEAVKKRIRPLYRQQLLPYIFYSCEEYPDLISSILHLTDTYRTYQEDDTETPLELIVFGCLSQFFANILQQGLYTVSNAVTSSASSHVDSIKSVLEYIEQHYSAPLPVEELAGVIGMNPKYFFRFFRSITNQTPHEYITVYRIEKAVQMLNNTTLSITDICMECGFNDTSNFIRVFRKIKGTTPSKYRKQ